MAKNQRFSNARQLYLDVPSNTKSGDAVMIGDLPGVALIDRDSDGKATVDTSGGYKLAVSGAVEPGDIVYFADGSLAAAADGGEEGEEGEEASDGQRFGYALEAGEDNEIIVKVGY